MDKKLKAFRKWSGCSATGTGRHGHDRAGQRLKPR
jgi:hypothetical protein